MLASAGENKCASGGKTVALPLVATRKSQEHLSKGSIVVISQNSKTGVEANFSHFILNPLKGSSDIMASLLDL